MVHSWLLYGLVGSFVAISGLLSAISGLCVAISGLLVDYEWLLVAVSGHSWLLLDY